ncbi:MAG: PrsW family intramembrane metalloprotease [Bacteroidaceae bacterium]|nr:PrsW family intramembrane metalloprotease [Bacteroidaceae bacterium]
MKYLVLFTALLPVIFLLYSVNKKDSKQPEPKGELVRAVFYGIISVFLSLLISTPLLFLGLYSEQPTTILGAISTAFLGAAIPEEVAKYVMLWLFLRNNKYFDERFDCILYAVCVSMGFAALENITYFWNNLIIR